jgi:hypothetical protein
MNANVKGNELIPILVDEEEDVAPVAPQNIIVKQINTIKPRSFSGASGDDINSWFNHLDVVATSNGWNQEEKFRHAVASLTNAAEKFFHSNMQWINNFALLKTAMEKNFGPANKTTTFFQQMDNMKQALGQPIMSYWTDKKYLLNRYDPNMSVDQQIHFIVRGLLPDIRKRLAGSKIISLDALLEKLKLYEEHSLMDAEDEQVYAVQSKSDDKDQAKDRKYKCWYCNKEGHMQRDCFKRQNDENNGKTPSFRRRKRPFTRMKNKAQDEKQIEIEN